MAVCGVFFLSVFVRISEDEMDQQEWVKCLVYDWINFVFFLCENVGWRSFWSKNLHLTISWCTSNLLLLNHFDTHTLDSTFTLVTMAYQHQIFLPIKINGTTATSTIYISRISFVKPIGTACYFFPPHFDLCNTSNVLFYVFWFRFMCSVVY